MNIIPRPSKARLLNGKVYFSSATKVSGVFDRAISFAEEILKKKAKGEANSLVFNKVDSFASEQYEIYCENGDIVVKAATEAGAFYALMTIDQLSLDGNTIDAVVIEDSPKYSYRGFMLDCARHFWSVKKIKSILDIMANIKLNIFHWHLSEDQGWRPEIKKYPLLTQKGCVRDSTPLSLTGYNADPIKSTVPRDNNPYGKDMYYSQDEMRDVVKYAKERHINIIPEIDMPGHLVAAIACYPELSCSGAPTEVCNNWGVMDNIGCCGSEKIYEFAKDVIDELSDIFPYEYFHIGGDEVPKAKWKTCPKCQAKIKELGLKDENSLQSHFNNEMAKHLKTKGKKTIGWNEILDAADVLDKDVVIQWWTPSINKQAELKWLASGGKAVISKWGFVYMDHAYCIRPLKKTYSFSAKSLGITDDKNVLGVEAPQWTEYIRTEEKLDFNTMPRLLAMAEVGWTAEKNKGYACFENRLEKMREYFEARGAKMPSKKMYRGKSISPFMKYAKGWVKWRHNPNFELDMSKNQK